MIMSVDCKYEELGFSKQYMSASQVAKEMGVNREFVYEQARRMGQDFAIQTKPGGRILINTVKFIQFLNNKTICGR